MTRYVDIVFCQGDDANEPLDILDQFGVDAAAEYLAQWDYGESASEFNSTTTPSAGTSDYSEATSNSEYIVTWNLRLGYIGLERVESEVN